MSFLSPKKRSRSVVSLEESHRALADVLPLLAEEGWLEPVDVCALERTCRDAKQDWCNDAGVWQPLALRVWPQLRTVEPAVIVGEKIRRYKSFFCDPSLWLAASADRVRRLPKWSEKRHFDVECGRCGCNCYEDCPGIQINSDFRWEKIEQVDSMERLDVPHGEGYKNSGGKLIALNRFCEPCFHRLVKRSIVSAKDYTKEPGKSLYDFVAEKIVESKTTKPNVNEFPRNRRDKHVSVHDCYFSPSSSYSWQRVHNKVNADDLAIVVANALVQKGCTTQFLQFNGVFFNDPGFGPQGYKALAFALAINKTIERINFLYYDNFFELEKEEAAFSYAADKSNGLFLKALKHNTSSSLKKLSLMCPAGFGPHTWEAWREANPALALGRSLSPNCYFDYHEYVTAEDSDSDWVDWEY